MGVDGSEKVYKVYSVVSVCRGIVLEGYEEPPTPMLRCKNLKGEFKGWNKSVKEKWVPSV